MNTPLISADAYRAALALPDLTDAARAPHALQLLVQHAIAALRSAWRCELIVHRAHPVVSVRENYDLLHYPPGAAAREARYTRYVSATEVLRTHTSAMIPALLRSLAPAPYRDVLLACPGLVYRRDAIDRLHVGEPHQLDLWRLTDGSLGNADLREMVQLVMNALLPGREYRALRASHPYTQNGLEVESRVEAGWIEVLECGLAAPTVLEHAGLPTARYSGLAMGIGLDRVLMLRKGIDDIRLLRSTDPRVVSQMVDLAPYRPVSSMPAIRRDLSVAVAVDTTPEELGDRVRAALGSRAEAVETVEVLSDTPVEELPSQAVARIGIAPDQKNMLVKVVLQHPTRTLTSEEANELRDDI